MSALSTPFPPAKKSKRTTFPCPVCEGKGGYKEVVTDDGDGPYYPCYCCGDAGQMVIGSEDHKKYFFSSMAWYNVIYKFDSIDEDLQDITEAETQLIREIEGKLRALWTLLQMEEGK